VNIYFRNIRVVSPANKMNSVFNLWLKDGLITGLSTDEITIDSDTETVDAEELVCSPGFFDMHVHLREPGQEYKEDIKTGTMSAANGGFTGVCCMPNTDPAIDNITVVEYINQKAKNNLVDVIIAGSITQHRGGKLLSPMIELNDHGVPVFTDDGSCVTDSEVMRRAFDYAASRDLLLSQHCEDHSLTDGFSANESDISARLGLKGYPSIAEEIIIARDIALSEYCGNRRYHVSHISTKGAVRIVADAKKRGLRVTCEVTPHHFLLTDEVLVDYNTNHKMNPPLRSNDDVGAILEGLANDTIDCIATDHAPHALHEKDVEYESAPNGIIGLETAIGLSLNYLVHKGHLTLDKLVEKMSDNPRKILNLPEIKIMKGEKANLTIFNPDEDWIVNKELFKSKSKNSPFEGMKIKGKPKYAVNNNRIIKCKL
jgi:dihydroorotase